MGRANTRLVLLACMCTYMYTSSSLFSLASSAPQEQMCAVGLYSASSLSSAILMHSPLLSFSLSYFSLPSFLSTSRRFAPVLPFVLLYLLVLFVPRYVLLPSLISGLLVDSEKCRKLFYRRPLASLVRKLMRYNFEYRVAPGPGATGRTENRDARWRRLKSTKIHIPLRHAFKERRYAYVSRLRRIIKSESRKSICKLFYFATHTHVNNSSQIPFKIPPLSTK